MKKKYLACQDELHGPNQIEHRFYAIDNDAASDIVRNMIGREVFRYNENVAIYVLSELDWSWEFIASVIAVTCET